ncbi:sensor histidine kinase [Serpentinicella alkaliphila]|uniref:histidine kinase n=1 Tax=Serpentinicella alkaliphila TaxID=1734049 RepID=A0A4R2U2Y7_9FIRM|nr:sensor histidine kinase [Serpentinicella alkaliphila]QUH26948.1 sensor histidine kinase [Serpentinicella alkaliphila]TCQ08185.1 two-component system sensor histidine kinase DegS [Serpentinicella alkaliphila]
MNHMINTHKMNDILSKVTAAIDESKREIFDIAESARNEYNDLKKELIEIQKSIQTVISEVDKLEVLEKKSRKRLVDVSKNFIDYNEEDIREAYEKANEFQINLVLRRQQEKELIKKRTETEFRLKNAAQTLQKAENLTSKMGIVLEFLDGNIQDITSTLEDIQQKHVLAKRIIQAQEDERQRIARDIHDGPAQSLSNVVIKAEVCEKLIDIDTNRTKIEIDLLKKNLRDTIKDIRKIIYNLRPMSLDDLGFVPTIQQYIKNFQDETDIEVDFVILSKQWIEDKVKNLCIFRVIQEALNNVRKHSNASLVKLRIEMTKEYTTMSIIDNGLGFNIEEVESKDKIEGGFGLMNMEERVKLLNGNFEIKSTKNNGTRIFVHIPHDN